MATAAQPLSGIDMSAADAMDVHSDSGFDFGDGDIELDLEPAPSAYHHDGDDDVSIHDAATDGGLELHPDSVDQDDFMADNDDLIEPDNIEYGNEDATVVGQSPMSDSATTPAQTLEPADEDLIDYSDDEDEQQPRHDQGIEYHEGNDAQGEVSAVSQVSLEEDLQAPASAEEDHDEHRSEHSAPQDTTGQDTAVSESRDHESPQSHQEPQPQANDEAYTHQDSEDGGILLQEPESPGNEAEDNHGNNHSITQDGADNTDLAAAPVSQDNEPSELRPVTVNYGGNDLWLFKQYDTDDSGDWLLEDVSLAGSSMSDLFQACRSALGDDVSNETEIGFRFDHLHNLELYEDNTACVAVALERLVDLYHTLHAQDGDNEPECFYVTLQFRPRFATLLADIAKYAEQGSGFSGLSTAVIAGETHFTKLLSGASTEHDFADWESEEHEDLHAREEEPIVTQSADDILQQEETHGGSKDGDGESEAQTSLEVHEHPEQEQHHDNDDQEHHNRSADAENTLQEEYGEEQNFPDDASASSDSVDTDSPSKQPLEAAAAEEEIREEQESHVSNTHHESGSATESQKREEEDFIDYSDDEGHDDVVEVECSSAKEHSPSSSTVQGDELAADGDEAYPVEPAHDSSNDREDFDKFAANTETQDDPTLVHQEQDGDTYDQEQHSEFDQTYDQGNTFENYQENDTEEFLTQPDFEGDTNQDFHGHEYEIVDQQVQADLDNEVEKNEDDENSNVAANDFTGIEDFLDFNDASEWATNEEMISTLTEDAVLAKDDVATHGDEEGRAAEQPAAMASPTANPVATSSTDSTTFSPQGQKRSIDEVDNEVGDALDSTGMSYMLLRKPLFG